MVMDKGRVIADDTAQRLKAELAGDVVTLGFGSADEASRAVAVVQGLTDRDVRREGEASIIVTAPDGEALLPAAVRTLDAAGIVVRSATGVPPTLDDVFLALTGRTLREAGEGGESDPSTSSGTDATSSGTDATSSGTEAADIKEEATR